VGDGPRRGKHSTSQLPANFVYGINPVNEALGAGALRRLFLHEGASRRLGRLRETADAAGIAVEPLEEAPWFPALEGFSHQGAAGITELYAGVLLGELLTKLDDIASVLLLDGVNDPQNLGAVIRSAAAAGAAVVLPKHGSAPVNCTVHKASAGATYRASVVLGENLSQAMDRLKEHDFWVVSLDPREGESVFSFDFPRRAAFVVGSEERGVRKKLREKSDFAITIPMRRGVESLNLGVSTALALYFFRAHWERGD
jgi:23S rRNA (guanosine2251-2'-O)-methyltransferase